MRNCCSNCFKDQYLQKEIERMSDTVGDCNFCDKNGVSVIYPNQLSSLFETVCSIYTESSDGIPMVKLLDQDWRLFNVPDEMAERLFQGIFDGDNRFSEKYMYSETSDPEGLVRWRQLKTELMTRNRYFLETQFQNHLSRLEDWLTPLCMTFESQPNCWYRARIEDNRVFSASEMGTPPPNKTGAGRANPVGIPYLYLGSNEDVVINEVRPHIGDGISIAKFNLAKSVKLIDLRDPKSSLSPFSERSPEKVVNLRDDILLLQELNEELSKPVLQKEAATEYIPSQYFCEFLKFSGYDGIVYDSSFGEGVNVAVFKNDNAQVDSTGIKSVNVCEVAIAVVEQERT